MSQSISLRNRVRKILRERGWSQAQLARTTRIAPSMLSRLLRGSRPFAIHHIEAIARAFEITPADLVVGTDATGLVQAMGSLVPREALEDLEKRLAEVSAQAQIFEAELVASREAKAQLEAQAHALTQKSEEALQARDEALVTARGLRAARQVENERWANVNSALATERARVQSFAAEILQLREAVRKNSHLANMNYDAWSQANAQVVQLREALGREQRGNVGAAFLTGLIGLGIGASSAKPRNRRG